MRTLACTLACSLVLLACGDEGNTLTTTSTAPTTDSTDPSTDPATDPSTDPATDPSTDPATDPSTDPTTGMVDPTDGDEADLMQKYGAPCMEDSECVALLGEGGVCLKDILMVYALPGGYCSTICALPDSDTTYILDAKDCKFGADCVGLKNYFEGCVHKCEDNSQCPREGYECRTMPTISQEGDPTFCLMTEDNMIMP